MKYIKAECSITHEEIILYAFAMTGGKSIKQDWGKVSPTKNKIVLSFPTTTDRRMIYEEQLQKLDKAERTEVTSVVVKRNENLRKKRQMHLHHHHHHHYYHYRFEEKLTWLLYALPTH